MATNNFTIEGRAIKNFPDVQRTWLWELSIPQINKILPQITDEIFTLHCRTVSIPGRSNQEMTSNFMGMVQFFPGKPAFPYTVDVQLEETEDQIVHQTMINWMNDIFDVNPGDALAGQSSFSTKRDGCLDMYLQAYKYDGTTLPSQIKFVNAYPTSIGDVAMDYSSNEQVKFPVTFRYDFWTFA